MSGCESTVSPEPSSTCEAASAMVPPRRHGTEGHGHGCRRFRFRLRLPGISGAAVTRFRSLGGALGEQRPPWKRPAAPRGCCHGNGACGTGGTHGA